MSYSFLFGPSGSGKTTRAFREMIDASVASPEKRFFIMVPEQYGMLMQRKLLLMHPRHASGNIEVMSFNRLAWRVFAELNIRNPEIMDDSGKAMVLRRVAAEAADQLTVWRNRLKRAGFTENVKSMISECCQYGVRPEQLRQLTEGELRLPLRRKLTDFCTLYEGFERFVAGKNLPKEEILNVFAGQLEKSVLLKGAVLLFDGFTGFTPVQYSLLDRLLAAAESLRFTVTLGREVNPWLRAGETELFQRSTEMVAKITALGADRGIRHESDVFLDETPRFSAAGRDSALSFLERHFLRYDGAVFAGKPEGISVFRAANPAAEAARAASAILRLVKQRGFRWRDIAVVAADFENYAPLLQHEFMRQGIPCYMDRNLSVAANPLPELLRAALGCVTDHFSDRSFLRFLKCGLVTEDRRTAALCDCYMTLCGVRGYTKLSARWEYVPRELAGVNMEAVNALKDRALALLAPLRALFSEKEASAGAVAAALRALMEQLGTREKLQAMAERFSARKDAEHAREFEAVYAETDRILREMEQLLGEELLGREDMSGVMDAGLREIRVGQIPPFADQVVVGDLTRSRRGDIRALLLLGANDGLLPARKQEGGILSDREREQLRAAGVTLSLTAREELCAQRYDLYRALTSPSDLLYISFAAQSSAGKTQDPSGILNHLFTLFPRLSAETKEAEGWFSALAAERSLIAMLREARQRTEEALPEPAETAAKAAGICGRATAEGCAMSDFLAGYCAEETRKRAAFQLIDAACFRYEGESIGREAARQLYGEQLSGSVTRIETFFRCPFSHFLKYGLQLTELKPFEFAGRDIGMLAHRAIETVFLKAEKEGVWLPALDDTARDRFAERCVLEAAEGDDSGLYRDSAKNVWLIRKLSGIIVRSVRIMTEQLKRGDYRPAVSELAFSAASLSALRLRLPGGGSVRLSGKTDRVDLCADSQSVYVKIIDYKTGKTVWEPYRMLSGSQIQLLLYLDAVTALLETQLPDRRIVPGAIFYVPVEDPFLKRREAEDQDAAFRKTLKNMRPSGLINAAPEALRHLSSEIETAGEFLPVKVRDGKLIPGEQTVSEQRFAALRRYVRSRIRQAGEAILRGDVRALPLEEGGGTACEYCPYSAVCGFDGKISGYQFRRNRKRSAAEVWEEMDRQNSREGVSEEETGEETPGEEAGR